MGIETLTGTIFASNDASIALFRKMGFEQWGFLPPVARLEGFEKDLVLVGRRLQEPGEIALMQQVKRMLDPHGIMNPGRVLPPA